MCKICANYPSPQQSASLVDKIYVETVTAFRACTDRGRTIVIDCVFYEYFIVFAKRTVTYSMLLGNVETAMTSMSNLKELWRQDLLPVQFSFNMTFYKKSLVVSFAKRLVPPVYSSVSVWYLLWQVWHVNDKIIVKMKRCLCKVNIVHIYWVKLKASHFKK